MTDFLLEFLSHWIWLSLGIALVLYSFKGGIPGVPESEIVLRILAVLCLFGALIATVLDVHDALVEERDEVRESQGLK